MKTITVGNLIITSEELGDKTSENVKLISLTSKCLDSEIGPWGLSMTYVARPTANCQLASIRSAGKLTRLNQEEFNDLVKVFRTRKIPGMQKLTLLIDVYENLRSALTKRVKGAGGRVLMSRKYKNNTGSNMAIMILDLTKRDKNGKAC